MTTFSQLVDEITLEVRRPDLRTDIATYLNQTIREMHFEPSRGAAAEFLDNLKEVRLTATSESGFAWDIPNPALFQRISAVKYESIPVTDEKTRWIRERTPGPGLSGQDRFWYRAGSQVNFAGYGGVGAYIALAYYEFPRTLRYYPPAQRPAMWDVDYGWTYAAEFDVTDELRESARRFSTNWMLERWELIIAEGLRAKVYKRISDTERARTCYSAYTTLRNGVYTSETSAN